MKNNGLWDRWAQTPPSVKIAIMGVLVIWATIVAALVAGVVLLRPGAEQALQPTPEMVIPKIALEPAAGPVGAPVTVRGEGWPAGGTILIYLVPPGETERPSQATSSATADAQGRFTIQFWIPREPGWETQGLAVVIAQTTEGGLAAQAPFSVVKEPGQPTLTAVLSQTPSPTLTPSPMSPTATPLPGRPVATAITDLNIRAGPGMGYPVLGVLRAGQSAEITGASADGGWWQIRFSGVADPQGEGAPGRGWISARYVTAQDTQNVPVAQAPALPTTPTRVPTPTSLPTPTSTLASVSITDWRGEYYDNPDLRGSPTHVRNDVSVNFDWGAGAPAAGVDADNFSARWSRALDFSAGTYRFTVRADDGVRLWVDGALVIDQWHASSGTTYSTDVNLTHGMHTIRMEYYERGGQALARLAWERLDQYADWKAEYYSNSE
ncbi:MAG: SH3 domain-containing protein, partial [Anaerolineales bacterium]